MAKKPATGKRIFNRTASTARVAIGPSSDAQREAAAFYKRTPPERIIKLLTVQEILDEEHVKKM